MARPHPGTLALASWPQWSAVVRPGLSLSTGCGLAKRVTPPVLAHDGTRELPRLRLRVKVRVRVKVTVTVKVKVSSVLPASVASSSLSWSVHRQPPRARARHRRTKRIEQGWAPGAPRPRRAWQVPAGLELATALYYLPLAAERAGTASGARASGLQGRVRPFARRWPFRPRPGRRRGCS